jgi:hypothetical protein
MAKKLSVITNPENGWDCVVAIVEGWSDKLEGLCDRNGWIVHSPMITTADQVVRDYGDDYSDEDEEE